MNTEGYKFVTPETPKAGDVVYVSASMRGGTSDHWAIVKSYNGSSLTLFEQNVKSGGQAIVDRQLKYPSKSYHLYTPRIHTLQFAESGSKIEAVVLKTRFYHKRGTA